MLSKENIIDLFKRQWPNVNLGDIDIILKDSGGISTFECILMYLLIIDRKPQWIIEFSPNHGYSTQAIALALKNLNLKNRFATFEIKPNFCQKTQEKINSLQLSEYVQVIQGDAIEKIPLWIKENNAKVDFVFIDSDHREKFANDYINTLFPLFQDNALIGVHDICSDKRDDNGQTPFRSSLGKGAYSSGEEKPIAKYLIDGNFCVLHAITGGQHEQANLPVNKKMYDQLLDICNVNFHHVKSRPCPKSIWFLNRREI